MLLEYNWFLAQKSLRKLLSRVTLTSWVQLETHYEQFNSVGLDRISPCNVTSVTAPTASTFPFANRGGCAGKSDRQGCTVLLSFCWNAARRREADGCLHPHTHPFSLWRFYVLSFKLRLWPCLTHFTHFTTLRALWLLHHCGNLHLSSFLLPNNPRCSTLHDSTMAPTKFMDLSVDIKTLIVQHVSLVLLVLLAGPISLVFPNYGGCRAASSVTAVKRSTLSLGKHRLSALMPSTTLTGELSRSFAQPTSRTSASPVNSCTKLLCDSCTMKSLSMLVALQILSSAPS